MKVTNAERLVIAMALQAPWSGAMEVLEGLYDTREGLKLAEYDAYVTVNIPANLASDEIAADYKLTDGALLVLASSLPGANTPAALGPTKVRLLRKLIAAAPKPKVASKDKPNGRPAA